MFVQCPQENDNLTKNLDFRPQLHSFSERLPQQTNLGPVLRLFCLLSMDKDDARLDVCFLVCFEESK